MTWTGPERYGKRPPRPAEDSEDYWLRNARNVILDMLDQQHAITASEMEARASDRTWNPTICPYPINPHWLVNARNQLRYQDGEIDVTESPTKGHPEPITTWHRTRVRGLGRLIDAASGRKRLLTARHAGWSRRGGAGRGLIGRAGENALDSALREHLGSITAVTGSTHNVLGIDLRGPHMGEIDNSAFYVDTADPANPHLIQLLFEVKNTREWYYLDNEAVARFLVKAAHLQQQRPNQLMLPVFVCRRLQYKLWEASEQLGFLPVRVEQQLVLPDHELTPASLEEVRTELGYSDLVLGDKPTARHRGMLATAIPRRAHRLAELWQHHHTDVLAATGSLENVALPLDLE